MNPYPVQYVRRPLTLGEHALEFYGTTDLTRVVKDTNDITRELQTNLGIDAGAGFGITPNLEVHAVLATVQILPKAGYGNPIVSSTYRFLNSGMELGVRLQAQIFTKPDQLSNINEFGAVLEPSVPGLVHLGKSARFDFGAGLPVTVQKGKATTIGIDAPIAFSFQLVDAMHLGLRSSLYINDFKYASRYLTVPLGVFAGISLGSEKPFFEIDPFFTWPQFATPGAEGASAKKVNFDVFTAGGTVRIFIFL